MADAGGRRPKRRCARTVSSSMPSAVHYVGYVEDDETPEMIMAKFGELEHIQKEAGEAAEAAKATVVSPDGTDADGTAAVDTAQPAERSSDAQELTDDQLLQVFKQTSMFNVRTALQDNAMLMSIDEVLEYTNDRYGSDEEHSDDDDFLRSFWSDEEGEFLEEEGDGDEYGRSRSRRGSGGRRAGPRAQRNAGALRSRHSMVTAYNPATQALVRRKVRVAGRDEVVHVRVPPPPLPLSWGRSVKLYVPKEQRGLMGEAAPSAPAKPAGAATTSTEAEADAGAPAVAAPAPAGGYIELPSLGELSQAPRLAALPVRHYQAVLINPGWERQGDDKTALSVLRTLPVRTLVPGGFVFIWTPKHRVQAVCKLMKEWDYSYIENLTWVWLSPANSILRLPSPWVRSSHLTLYMFRAAGRGRDIELRHQRNPDVTFDCVAAGAGGQVAVPDETFVAVETLLPTGRGKFLELWAPREVRRPGWTHVVEAEGAEG